MIYLVVLESANTNHYKMLVSRKDQLGVIFDSDVEAKDNTKTQKSTQNWRAVNLNFFRERARAV